MKTTAIALTLLAAGVHARPSNGPRAMSKRGERGTAGPMGNSGYSAPVSQDLAAECLQAHNDARAAYGYPPLRWNPQLAESAQGWSNHIGSNMQHSGHDGYGENLAFNSNGSPRDMILDQWFDECPSYDGRFSSQAGHYSQCIWKSTTDVGCGMNRNNMLVCQYYPAGNMEGEYGSNVPRPGQCVTAAGLKPGSGGNAPAPAPGYGGGESPAPANPGYGGGAGSSPAPANPGYGGGESPAPANPGYGGGAGSSPAPANPGYGGGEGASPAPANPGYGGGEGASPGHGGHGGRPKPRPKPQPKPEDCDESDQSPQHGGHGGRPKPRPAPQPVYHSQAPTQGQGPSHGGRPWGHGGHGGRPQNDDEDESPRHGGHGGPRPYGGGRGSSPSNGGDYGNQGQGPSRGGNGGYGGGRGGRGSSGGHGGNDDDCED